tara:strand:- start:286 stop:402 length:117 start_codon:yes stop_codon:yes gene_type:complete
MYFYYASITNWKKNLITYGFATVEPLSGAFFTLIDGSL